jgi:O-antigen biosynthesis protein
MTPEFRKRLADLYEAGRFHEALALVLDGLRQLNSSECWNDWAALQFRVGRVDEAEAGFRVAVEKDPNNTQAVLNLGTLLFSVGGYEEAEILLRQLGEGQSRAVTAAAKQLLASLPQSPSITSSEIEGYLRRFVADTSNEKSYFNTHIKRYVATIQTLPGGLADSRLLELGAAFHHLTPALVKLKNYASVRCNDLWEGEAQKTRCVRSLDGIDEFSFVVDNFDVQNGRWPYDDQVFDTVLCCEMLEHLHSDPMHVLAEINRILKPNGTLLLTTPNIAGGHAIEFCLRGESPYVYGKFEQEGAPTDRHNREYTASEVQALSNAAGFECIRLRTINSWWSYSSDILRDLVLQGHSIARRGDNTVLLARKSSGVTDRYPTAFYQTIGTQSPRRAAQAAGSVPDLGEESLSFPARNILLVHEVLPHHDCSGADLRFLDVVRELRQAGNHVTYFARSGKNAARYLADLESLGVRVAIDPMQFEASSEHAKKCDFRTLIGENAFDLAIFFHWFWAGMSVVEQYSGLVREVSPSTRVVVLTDDRHGERERRAAKLSGKYSDFERANSFEAREREAYASADMLLYITESDKDWFEQLVPNLRTMLLPMVADVPSHLGYAAERSGALFLGNFENLANTDALQWLLSEVWPLVLAAEPNLVLYVAGHGISHDALCNHKNVVSLGKTDDLSSLFDARRLFVSPVRYGTGINTKNLQALARGLPLVTTSVGAEGLRLQHDVHALISDSAQEFASSIIRLHRDNTVWTALAGAGLEFTSKHFSRANLRQCLKQILERVMELEPKSDGPPPWSYREIEQACDLKRNRTLPQYQAMESVVNYWVLGRRYMDREDFSKALGQFQHVFTLHRGNVPKTVFDRALLRDMHRCYVTVGDKDGQSRCEAILRQAQITATSSHAPSLIVRKQPEISVVFPTHNRCELLHSTLAAWAFQTLPSDQWELIVVDDGSGDGTEKMCRSIEVPYHLRYVRQENAGAGAARRIGTKTARGEFLLLCNDDTIPDSRLLEEHLRLHRQSKNKNIAALGKFTASTESAKRALSFFVNRSAFLFPQTSLQVGQLLDQAYFITCNLSVRRDQVLAAGNFDPTFRVAEDTELGARLVGRGIRVVYHPEARADHEHGIFTTADLVRRAKAYGRADWDLFKKHPWLLGTGDGPFGKLTKSDIETLHQRIEQDETAVSAALVALTALDDIDFLPLLHAEKREAAQEILESLSRLVPMVYWHHLLRSFLEASQADQVRTVRTNNLNAVGSRQ